MDKKQNKPKPLSESTKKEPLESFFSVFGKKVPTSQLKKAQGKAEMNKMNQDKNLVQVHWDGKETALYHEVKKEK